MSQEHRLTLESHHTEQMLENADFMLEGGEHITRVASRLGVEVETLQKALERRAKGGR